MHALVESPVGDRELAMACFRLLLPHLEGDRVLRTVANKVEVLFRTLQRWVEQIWWSIAAARSQE